MVSASSTMDPSLDKAEDVSHVCGSSGRVYLRKGKNDSQGEEKGEKCEKQFCEQQSQTRRRMRRCFKQNTRYSPAAIVGAAHGVDHTRADIHPAAHEGSHTGQVGYFKKQLHLLESPCWRWQKCEEEGAEVLLWTGCNSHFQSSTPLGTTGRASGYWPELTQNITKFRFALSNEWRFVLINSNAKLTHLSWVQMLNSNNGCLGH